MRIRRSRRGVSQIIAALLIVCIVVSAGTLFGAYASGVMGKILNPVTSQPYTEQLTLEYYNWLNCPSGSTCTTPTTCSPTSSQCPTLTIRNDGAAKITLADFYMQGVKNTTDLTTSSCPSPNAYVLPVQSPCTLTFPIPYTTQLNGCSCVTSGNAVTVKFVANDGTIFTFSIIAGSNTH